MSKQWYEVPYTISGSIRIFAASAEAAQETVSDNIDKDEAAADGELEVHSAKLWEDT